MIRLLLFIFLIQGLWAKPIVMLGYFTPFNQKKLNNSDTFTQEIIKKNEKDFQFIRCEIPSVYSTSYDVFRECLKKMEGVPDLILGFGEGDCDLKFETILKNLDDSDTADNMGAVKRKEKIISTGADFISLNYPLKEAYCQLDEKEQESLVISFLSGGFLCNHLAYQVRHFDEDLTAGFIHVPNHQCKDLVKKNMENVALISKMLQTLVTASPVDLPLYKSHLVLKREQSKREDDKCGEKFYKQIKGTDELSFWPFSMLR